MFRTIRPKHFNLHFMTIHRFFKHILTLALVLVAYNSYSRGDDTVRILAIGNSFSMHAVEQNLSELCRDAGKQVIIGHAFIDGSALSRHAKNAKDGSAPYFYRKITVDGTKSETPKSTLLDCVTDEPWDYISFHQVSGDSGFENTYFPYLPDLMTFVKDNATNTDAQFILMQVWPYDANHKHPAYPRYGNSQDSMHRQVARTVDKVAKRVGIDIIIPAGTALQNVRLNLPGVPVTRDGVHLNAGLGEFSAACVWFEKLFGGIRKNKFVPSNVPDDQAAIAKKAAYFAVKKPNETTIFVKSERDGKKGRSKK